MKKFLIFLITSFCLIQNVVASGVATYERTKNDYLVPSDIKVNYKNESSILKTPAVDAEKKVYDFANLLTDNEELLLFNQITDYIEGSSYDLAVVTINDNNKYSAADYADDFFDYNDFGINSSRDGLLILIDMDNREIWVSTSGYAIKMYSDTRIDRIIDDGFYYLTSGDYYNCLIRMINKMDSYYDSGYPIDNQNLYIDENGKASYIRRIPYLMIILISGVISLITSLILYFKTSSKIKKQTTVTYINPNLSNLIKRDQFVTTHTSRIRINTSSGSSGGGSSFHSGSSGRSHGGGGRHF